MTERDSFTQREREKKARVRRKVKAPEVRKGKIRDEARGENSNAERRRGRWKGRVKRRERLRITSALGSSFCVVSLDSSHVFGGRDKTVSHSHSDKTKRC